MKTNYDNFKSSLEAAKETIDAALCLAGAGARTQADVTQSLYGILNTVRLYLDRAGREVVHFINQDEAAK